MRVVERKLGKVSLNPPTVVISAPSVSRTPVRAPYLSGTPSPPDNNNMQSIFHLEYYDP